MQTYYPRLFMVAQTSEPKSTCGRQFPVKESRRSRLWSSYDHRAPISQKIQIPDCSETRAERPYRLQLLGAKFLNNEVSGVPGYSFQKTASLSPGGSAESPGNP